MCLDHRRHKFHSSLAGVAGLLLVILTIPRSAIVYAQEDDAFTVTPSFAGDDADLGWEPTADAPEEADPGAVLELPQVVAIDRDEAATASAEASDPAIADDESQDPAQDPAQDQSDQLSDYAAQRATADEAPRYAAPMTVPGAPLAPVSAITSYVIVSGHWAAPVWSGIGVMRPSTPWPISPTRPMFAPQRGSRVIIGGWWHRAR
jgi:hypothetical protein